MDDLLFHKNFGPNVDNNFVDIMDLLILMRAQAAQNHAGSEYPEAAPAMGGQYPEASAPFGREARGTFGHNIFIY